MFGSTVFDVIMALAFTFLLLSMIVSRIAELVADFMKWRAKALEEGVQDLLSDPDLAERVWNHPLIQGLTGRRRKALTYIPAKTFALALFDAILPASEDPTALDRIRMQTMAMPESSARQAIITIVDSANGDIENARVRVEEWFNAAMDRVSVGYRKRMQWLAVPVALLVSLIFGVDTVHHRFE